MSQSKPASPTRPPPPAAALNSALARNIAALQERRNAEDQKANAQDRLAEAITAFTGSMAFVYVHVAMLAAWILINVGAIPGVPKFDRTFVILATAASVEAIFLSTFVLISQNRAAVAADRRADLDLQINLLAEHEITQLIALNRAMAHKLGVTEIDHDQLEELERDIAPEAVLDELDRHS